MIRKRLVYAAFAAQLATAITGATPSLASPGQPATNSASVIPFTCAVHTHLQTCGHVTVRPGERLYIQLDHDSPLDTALFCVPRPNGRTTCRQLHSQDDASTYFGRNNQNRVIHVPVNVGVGAPDRHTGTVTGLVSTQ